MRRDGTAHPSLAAAGLCALVTACIGDPAGQSNNTPPCNHDHVCDADEACLTCADCCVSCTLIGTSGTGQDFLVSELYIPDNASDGRANGVDLDGDGVIDNKLFSPITILSPQGGSFDVSENVNADIADGNILLVVRVVVDQLGNDDVVLAQVLQAVVVNDDTPIFDGNDEVALDLHAPRDSFLCGRIVNDTLEAGPGTLGVLLTLAIVQANAPAQHLVAMGKVQSYRS